MKVDIENRFSTYDYVRKTKMVQEKNLAVEQGASILIY